MQSGGNYTESKRRSPPRGSLPDIASVPPNRKERYDDHAVRAEVQRTFRSRPLVALFASRPVALRQGLKTTADVVQYAQKQQARVG
jgi:hypothetical protein